MHHSMPIECSCQEFECQCLRSWGVANVLSWRSMQYSRAMGVAGPVPVVFVFPGPPPFMPFFSKRGLIQHGKGLTTASF